MHASSAGRLGARRVVLVEYFAVDTGFLVFGVRADFERPEVVHIPAAHDRLRRFVASSFGGSGRLREFLSAGLEDELWHGAWDRLVAPIANWAARDDIVCIVPHGYLHYLPLHALALDAEPLAVRNAIVYSPSASALRTFQRRQNRGLMSGNRSAAVFGDPTGDLPFARNEAKAVAAFLGTQARVGSDATRAAFLHEGAQADILHLATHAVFDPDEPLRSSVRFVDGALSARDLLAAGPLHAKLVTLTGCETGVSERRPGDELMGLTRAFLVAGAATVLVSLWRVSDASSSFLAERFYQELASDQDMPRVDALRRAMLSTRERWPSLYHWAPFVLIGDWR